MSAVTVESIARAGVVGAGGAGFPTHVKLAGKADSVIINAAECEPLLHKDKEVLRHYTRQCLDGLTAAMKLMGASAGYIGIKEKYSELIEILRGMLPSGVEVAPLRDVYPAGDEFVLVYNVLGRVIPPGGIPLHVGAAVMNVETAVNVANSAQAPVTEKFVSVAGAVESPCTLRVPVGVTLRQCVEAAGGEKTRDAVYVVGGVMMGRVEDNIDALVTKTTGAIIVLPSQHIVVRRHRREWKHQQKIGRSACDQCSFCTELCPRYLLGHPIEPHRAMRSLVFNLAGEVNVMGSAFCCECNLCSMYSCPEDLDPRSVCSQHKRRLAGEGKRYENPPFNPRRPELHMANRNAPMRRLFQKLGLQNFHNVGALSNELLATRRVGIALKQHVGAPCEAAVAVGQSVRKGDVVGKPGVKDGKPLLGAPVHASISGKVTAIENGVVYIEE